MKAHYLIFHPKRNLVEVEATIIKNNQVQQNWLGKIFVDQLKYGQDNECPFVFSDPWLYSYCHATQLQRTEKVSRPFVKRGSWIIFVDGHEANQKNLLVDTVFLVGDVGHWVKKANLIPEKYANHQNNVQSLLWNIHFKHGIRPVDVKGHKGEYTYESEFFNNQEHYSFLPYNEKNMVNIGFEELSNDLSNLISGKLWGKRPVLLSEGNLTELLGLINKKTTIKVIKDIKVIHH